MYCVDPDSKVKRSEGDGNFKLEQPNSNYRKWRQVFNQAFSF